jgi:hypothetical protein
MWAKRFAIEACSSKTVKGMVSGRRQPNFVVLLATTGNPKTRLSLASVVLRRELGPRQLARRNLSAKTARPIAKK